jgi:hypothetical protein
MYKVKVTEPSRQDLLNADAYEKLSLAKHRRD